MLNPQISQTGLAKRHNSWDQVTDISAIGRQTLTKIPNYRLLKAATSVDATCGARLLLVQLISYLGVDQTKSPETRFVVWPGNTRLSDELRCTTRTIQRQADELEAKGLLRRCYNGLNGRVGFDLTPLAMSHRTIEATLEAIHQRRKTERDTAQLEMSLDDGRIARALPVVTSTSSGGDPDVTHNSSIQQNTVARFPSDECLKALDLQAFAGLYASDSVVKDRTGDDLANMAFSIQSKLTGGGRADHLTWTLAVQSLGLASAVALYVIADNDPKRRSSTERYFGWLLKQANSDSTAVQDATKRITAPKPVVPVPMAPTAPVVALDDASLPAEVQSIRRDLHDRLGSQSFSSWLGDAEFTIEDDILLVRCPSAFKAEWAERNLKPQITQTVQQTLGQAQFVRFAKR